jgi:hypothetical protein
MASRYPPEHSELSYHLLRVVRQKYTCDLDDLIDACAPYTWAQIFLEVDRLSRLGELSVVYKKAGDYAVRLGAGMDNGDGPNRNMN